MGLTVRALSNREEIDQTLRNLLNGAEDNNLSQMRSCFDFGKSAHMTADGIYGLLTGVGVWPYPPYEADEEHTGDLTYLDKFVDPFLVGVKLEISANSVFVWRGDYCYEREFHVRENPADCHDLALGLIQIRDRLEARHNQRLLEESREKRDTATISDEISKFTRTAEVA